MKKHNYTDFPADKPEPWEQSFYETGSTKLPKNRSGLIACALAVVIFLGGIVSGLSLLNIRLFSPQLSAPEDASFRFSPEDLSVDPSETRSALSLRTGLSGQEVSAFYQHYYRLPQGIYITDVDKESDAAAKGIVPGDILMRFAGESVSDLATFESLVLSLQPGNNVPVVIYRNGQQFSLELTIHP